MRPGTRPPHSHERLRTAAAALLAVLAAAGCQSGAHPSLAAERDDALRRANTAESLVRELQDEVAALSARLKELETLRAAETTPGDLPDAAHADGQVIRSVPSLRHLDIDLGSGNRIREGIRFKVYRRSATGHLRYVGAIQVTNPVEPVHARANVIETVDRDAELLAGDLIFNPLFSRSGPPNVSLAGEFDKRGHASRESILDHLAALGASVEEEFDPDHTDLLLVGNGPQGERIAERARRLGIAVLPVADALFYLGIG